MGKSPSVNLHIRDIQQDITCPECEYNLRGLRGEIVNCPECGCRCDVAKLVINRWRKPWYKAPGLSRINTPLACIVICGFISLIAGDAIGGIQAVKAMLILTMMLWLWSFIPAYMFFSGMEGVLLALMAHFVFAGYFAGVSGAAITVISLIGACKNPVFDYMALYMFFIIMFAFILWISRRGEKFIAGRCIRHHLRREAAHD